MNDFDLARADFQKVLQLYPNHRAAKAQQRIRKELEWEKKLYDNIFERLAGEESKAKATVAAGDQPADTEVKDGQKNHVAGGQPQVEAEVWPCPARLPAACPASPYPTPPCWFCKNWRILSELDLYFSKNPKPKKAPPKKERVSLSVKILKKETWCWW